ncbi:MAG: MFS transporter [Candidatus Hodarchaeales archaeon]|jgi:MFS family permease
MGIKKLNGGSPDNKTEYSFLTTEELRETRSLNQKVRNVLALGIYGTSHAVLIAFIIAYFNLSYLQGSDTFGLGLSPELAETIFSYSIAAGSIGFLGTVIIGGAFSDDYRSKYGARAPYILGGSLLAGIMLLLTPIFAGTADEDLMVILFPFCFFFVYVGLGLASSPNGALLSELFNKEQRGWVGLILAGFTILGSLIGLVFFDVFTGLLLDLSEMFQLGFIAEFSLFLFPALITIIGGIITFILVEKANPPYPPVDSPITDILQTPRYLMIGGSDFGKMFLVQSFWGFASESVALYLIIHLVASGLPEGDAPLALLVTGVVSAVMVIPAGIFIQKFGKVKTAIVGSLIYSGFCFLLAGMEIGGYFDTFLLIAAIGGFGAVFIESVRVSLPADLVPEGKEAQFMGINKFGSLWTQPFVALFGGFLLIALFDWEYSFTVIMFALAGLASLFATLLLFLISYEKMVRDEYEKFYKRYLTARGFFEEKLDKIVDSIL